MKKELLKKMKYEMPGMSKGKGPMPEDEMEVEISMGPESEEEVGMPKMAMEDEGESPEMEMDEEMEMPDLAGFSDEELQAELDKRMAKPAPGKSPAKMA